MSSNCSIAPNPDPAVTFPNVRRSTRTKELVKPGMQSARCLLEKTPMILISRQQIYGPRIPWETTSAQIVGISFLVSVIVRALLLGDYLTDFTSSNVHIYTWKRKR
ncbi:uncharacterized protein [Hetaerina americana]|uniref:uncharacterized protein n=1 Tax=Hetaerina americana TaxID=62018 RepID=UPI003A7F3C7B